MSATVGGGGGWGVLTFFEPWNAAVLLTHQHLLFSKLVATCLEKKQKKQKTLGIIVFLVD